MHELSIMEKLFKIVLREARQNKLTSINKVQLKIGKSRQIVPEFLEFAFKHIAKGTIADKAKLTIEQVSGKEIILESIEGEQDNENHH